ncbi:hypothetical protein PG985_009611 [Apiospora marii]|uniref:uncharacterized protein n=1 Tax=Apiospora marii TaxID=335849 RepID=UPI00312E5484
MANLLSGSALITGAASGIGHQTALAFAKYGKTKLALAGLDPGALAKTAEAIRAQYPDVETLELRMDVRSTAEVKAGFDAAIAKFGRLDVAVLNAGVRGPQTLTDETDDAAFDETLDINLAGVWRCQREALRVMLAQEDRGPREGRGRIINTASILGLFGPPPGLPHTPYAAAKHGVVGLTKADAVVYGQQGIRINCICPGWTMTPLITDPDDPALCRVVERGPVPRLAQVEEIADATVFLASPLSSFMQGASLVVDGGFTLT